MNQCHQRSRRIRCLIALAAIAGACGGGAPTSPSPGPAPAPLPSTAGRFDVVFPGAGATAGGVLFRPEITAGSVGAIVVVHGWLPPGSSGSATVEARAERYAQDGYVALALSMRGWPPSSGTDDCGLRQPDDVNAAAAWVATLPGVNAERIGIVGFSQGGQVALLAASRGVRFRAVVAYYPVTDVARWKTTTSHPTIPDYITQVCEPGGVAPRSPVSSAGAIAAPVLILHGDADTRVPTEQSERMRDALAAAGRSVELLIVPGAVHGFTAGEEAAVRPRVDAFMASLLK